MSLDFKWKRVCENAKNYKTSGAFRSAIRPLVEDVDLSGTPAQICRLQESVAAGKWQWLRERQLAMIGQCTGRKSIDQENLDEIEPAEFFSFTNDGKIYCDDATQLNKYFANSRQNYLTRAQISPATRQAVKTRAQYNKKMLEKQTPLRDSIDKLIMADYYRKVMKTMTLFDEFYRLSEKLTLDLISTCLTAKAIDSRQVEELKQIENLVVKKIVLLSHLQSTIFHKLRVVIVKTLDGLKRRERRVENTNQINMVFDEKSMFADNLIWLSARLFDELVHEYATIQFAGRPIFSPTNVGQILAHTNIHNMKQEFLQLLQDKKDAIESEQELTSFTTRIAIVIDNFYSKNFSQQIEQQMGQQMGQVY